MKTATARLDLQPVHPRTVVSRLPAEGHVFVSASLAREWLAHFTYRHQRPIRPWVVQMLKNEMVAGRFRAKTQIAFCRMKGHHGDFTIVNGHHTLHGITEFGDQVLLDIVITEVESEAQIADEYSRHDTHLTRRLSDSLVAHELHTSLDVTVSQLNAISAAACYVALMKGEVGMVSRLSHDEKLAVAVKYGGFGVTAMGWIEGNLNKSFLTRKTTLGAMIVTLEKQPERSAAFFGGVISDDGLRVGDPRKTVLAFLQSSKTMGSGSFNRTHGRLRQDHELVKGIAQAWNAYVGRRELVLIRPLYEARTVCFDGVGEFSV